MKKPLSLVVPPPPPWSHSGRAPPPLGLRRWFGCPLPLPSVASWRRCHPAVRALGHSAGRYRALPALPSSLPSGPPACLSPRHCHPPHLRPSPLPSPPSRGGSSSRSSQRRSRRRRWPGSPWRTVREAARRKSATTTMVRGRPAGGWVGGQGCGAGPGAAPGSAAAVASGRRC